MGPRDMVCLLPSLLEIYIVISMYFHGICVCEDINACEPSNWRGAE